MTRPLALHEEVLLLALRDREGTTMNASTLPYAMGGAVMCELLLDERIELEDKKKPKVRVAQSENSGNALLDEWWAQIAERDEKGKPRTMEDWVGRIAHARGLKEGVARELCDKRILREDKKKVLHFFERTVYPEIDPGPEREILGRIEDAIFSPAGEVEPRTAILVGLCQHSGLLKSNFDKTRLKRAKKRIEEITSGACCAVAAKKAIESAQAALVIITAVVATTAATTN